MTTATVTGPSFLALQVRDVEAAATFYETRSADPGPLNPRLAPWCARPGR